MQPTNPKMSSPASMYSSLTTPSVEARKVKCREQAITPTYPVNVCPPRLWGGRRRNSERGIEPINLAICLGQDSKVESERSKIRRLGCDLIDGAVGKVSPLYRCTVKQPSFQEHVRPWGITIVNAAKCLKDSFDPLA